MKPTPQQEHIRHSFDSFCKKVLKNEAINHQREMQRKREREVLFSEMTEWELERIAAPDAYPSDETHFDAAGYSVAVKHDRLAGAIAALPQDKRDVVLLAYFLGMTDKEIGQRLHIVRSTVQYKRTSSLRELRKMMEGEE